MTDKSFHFLEDATAEKLKGVVETFALGDTPPDKFLMKLKELLPVHRTDRETWKTRVEGFSHVADQLLELVLERGRESQGDDWTSETVKTRAHLRPLSYYHYVTGSREPASNVMKDEDYFNDPTTALVKLEDDIIALCKLVREI